MINLDLHSKIVKLLKKTDNMHDKLKAGKDYTEDEREQIKLTALTVNSHKIEKDYCENKNSLLKDNIKIYNNKNVRTRKRKK